MISTAENMTCELKTVSKLLITETRHMGEVQMTRSVPV